MTPFRLYITPFIIHSFFGGWSY